MISVKSSDIKINPRELKARLHGTPFEEISDIIKECTDEIFDIMNCQYYYIETKVQLFEDSCDLGFGKIPSRHLRKNLDGCQNAYVFAATLGHSVDRAIRSAGLTSALKQFVLDAVASCAVEGLCDYIQENLPCPTKARFSAGYGDFPLSFQQDMLDFVGAPKNIGITLLPSLLMNPTKSVTAIMGIKKY